MEGQGKEIVGEKKGECELARYESKEQPFDYLQLYMQNEPTVASKANNFFALNRLKLECYYKPITVDFGVPDSLKNQPNSIIPIFNGDNIAFTPAFLLPGEKSYYQLHTEQEREKFQDQIRHSENAESSRSSVEGTTNSLQFRPNANKYCQVCELRFQDYWEHVSDQYHSRKIKAKKSNTFIDDLCLQFLPHTDSTDIITKTKPIKKNTVKKKTSKKASTTSSPENSRTLNIMESSSLGRQCNTVKLRCSEP